MSELTVLIGPRDRYSGVLECVDSVLRHTPGPFRLRVLDLGYPAKLMHQVEERLAGVTDSRIIPMGLITPMQALAQLRDQIDTRLTAWIDNDSRVTEGWFEPLAAAIDDGAAIASPLILEKEGVDDGAELRNHLYDSEIRVVEVEGKDYLIEYKKHRRALPDALPGSRRETETFELHGVMFETAALQAIDIPDMVVREHIDICMQLKAMGRSVVTEPGSRVIFDNLGTRMKLSDMRFFFFRWDRKFSERSHRLFEERWGYPFYSERAMYNWAFRRKVFLIARFLCMPIWAANRAAGVAYRLCCREWDPLADPIDVSRKLYDRGVKPLRTLRPSAQSAG